MASAFPTLRRALLCGLVSLGLVAGPAQASLGGDLASVSRDRAALGASTADASGSAAQSVRRSSTSGSALAYTVHRLVTPAGVTVSEFLDASGAVFAVSWNGPLIPDLRQLLGDYFPAYSDALAARLATGQQRGSVALEVDALVVRSSGRMRAFSGIAYLKDKLPDGVSAADIR